MKITLSKNCVHSQEKVCDSLFIAIGDSRFKAIISCETTRVIKILNVRLKAAKPYCGAHPNACEIGGVDKKTRFLEGADWVEFNDLLNDALDKLSVDAKIASSVCVVRKGRCRRVEYSSTYVGRTYQWNKDEGDYAYVDSCCKTATPSKFPNGTPGIYTKTGYNMVG